MHRWKATLILVSQILLYIYINICVWPFGFGCAYYFMWLLLNKNDTINHNINIAFGYCIILQNVLQTKNTYDIPNLVCDLISFHHPNPFSSRREILERWKPLHRNIRSNPNPANGQCIGTLEVGIFLNYVVDCALISSPYLSIKGRSVMFKPPQAHCPCSFRPAGFGQ